MCMVPESSPIINMPLLDNARKKNSRSANHIMKSNPNHPIK